MGVAGLGSLSASLGASGAFWASFRFFSHIRFSSFQGIPELKLDALGLVFALSLPIRHSE
jgi:hypothetical protein